MSDEQNNAFNGLNFVKAFTTAYDIGGGLLNNYNKEKVSILHMEAFLFLMAHRDQDGIPLLNLQEALGHKQAKMQRIAVALQKVGWINIEKDLQDGRQRIVYLTETALAIFGNVSNCFSNEKNSFTYQTVSEQMKATIAEKTSEREVMMNADNILAGSAINAKASMNVNVEVVGVGAKGSAGNVQTAEQKAQAIKLKTDLRAVLEDKQRSNSSKIEVGTGYIRTDRGIVTFKVLLRRLKEQFIEGKPALTKVPNYGMTDVVDYLKSASNEAYEKMLTPTPKTRRGKLEAEIEEAKYTIAYAKKPIRSLEGQFGLDHIYETPHLLGTHRKYVQMLQLAQAELKLATQELEMLDANDEMLKMIEEMPAPTPEQEAALAEIEEKFSDQFEDFDVTEFPTTGETEKE